MLITRIVNSVFESNTFILSKINSRDVWLIDIGDINPIVNILSSTQTIKGVFITHTHYDHIYGINKLIELFPDCKIFTSENGRKGFLSAQYNFSRYHDDPIRFENKNITILRQGDTVQLTNQDTIKVYETPGHDWSSLVYQLGNKALFTGDSFIPGLKVITTFPKSDKEESKKSIKKIESLLTENTMVYPGHGDVFSYHQLELIKEK